MSDAPVFLTGATGFLGGEIVRQLVAGGREVHALARATSDKSALEGLPVHWHDGDLNQPASLEAALGGLAGRAPEVIHSAAVISYKEGGGPLQERVNVEGTRALLAAALHHGAGRCVHISSVVAVGVAPGPEGVLDEDAPWNGARLGDYARTKRAAEEAALSFARDDLDLCVVNPGAIFGPQAPHSNTTRFVEGVHQRRFGPFAPPGSLAVVGVEDVARGVLLALERGQRGRRYLLTHESLRLFEVLTAVAGVLGVRGPSITVRPALWGVLVGAVRAWNKVRVSEELTPQALHLLGSHFRFDASRARQELGWTPAPFVEVVESTVEWMRASGRLPG